MAIISKIRKRSGLVVTFVGIAIVGFILQDAFFSNRNQEAPPLAVINGESVSFDQYEQKVEEITNQYRRAQGEDIDITPEDLDQIRKMAWERMLSDVLLFESVNNLGIMVSQEEMNDMYYGKFISPFLYNYFTNPQTGAYDRQQVMMLINNFDQLSPEDRKTLSELEKVVKNERLKDKYYLMVSKSYYMPKALAEIKLHEQMDEASSSYVYFDFASIPDADITLEEADYKKYYDQNKYLFKQEESRAIDFVVFDVRPTVNDMLQIEDNIAKLYEDLRNESDVLDFVNTVSTIRFDSIYLNREQVREKYPYWDSVFFTASIGSTFAPKQCGKTFQTARLLDAAMRPDSVQVSHILISHKDAGSQLNRTKAEAKILADSLQQVLSKNIAVFPELAKTYSEDPSVQQNLGDLGWQREGYFIKAFNDAVLKNPVGTTTVVETPNGYHVLYVGGKTASVRKVLAAVVSIPIEPSSATIKDVYTKATRFFAECKDIQTMDSVAKKMGYIKRSSPYTEKMSMGLPGLSDARSIVRWAYGDKVKIGELGPEVYEVDEKYVVVALRDIKEKGYMPLSTVKENPQVEYVVKRDKKAEQLKANIEKEGKITSLEAFAAKNNKTIDTADSVSFLAYAYGNYSYEPQVVGSLFGMKNGQISKPIQGNSGIFVVRLNQFNAIQAEGDFEFVSAQGKAMFNQNVGTFVRGGLEKAATIEDNRFFYY